MGLIAYVFFKLLSLNDMVTTLLKRSCFRKPFGGECVKGSQKLLKSAGRDFYPTF